MSIDDLSHILEISLGLIGVGVFVYWYRQKPIKKRKALATAIIFWLMAGVTYNVLRCYGIPSQGWLVHAIGSGLDIATLALISIGGGLMIWAKS